MEAGVNIVVLKERRFRRELKNLDFLSAPMEEEVLRFAQDDNIANAMGYANPPSPKEQKA